MKRAFQILGLAALIFPGCRTIDFYSQAVGGQIEVLAKRKPIDRVIATTDDSELRARLQLTKRLLKFAEDELQLPTNGSYEVYSEIGREHLVWVVYASPELSMEPKQWWYPLIGRQDYRGFFKKEQADQEIAALEKQGLETWVNGVDAFSTLGWFRDPIMDTFVGRDEVGYVELILHELVHQKHYRSGETAFNEALAEAVAREGVKRWFRHTGRPELVTEYELWLKRLEQACDAIGGCSQRLAKIYQQTLSDHQKRALKAKEIKRLKKRLRQLRSRWGRGLKSWIEEPINNARLISFSTYEAGVPRFTSLLRNCDGDIERFWKAVEKMKP